MRITWAPLSANVRPSAGDVPDLCTLTLCFPSILTLQQAWPSGTQQILLPPAWQQLTHTSVQHATVIPWLHDQLAASGQLEVRNYHAGTAKEDYCACYSTLSSPFILRPLGFNFLIVIFTHFHVAPNLYAFCWTRYFEDCWSQMGPKTVWLPTFFKIYSYCVPQNA